VSKKKKDLPTPRIQLRENNTEVYLVLHNQEFRLWEYSDEPGENIEEAIYIGKELNISVYGSVTTEQKLS